MLTVADTNANDGLPLLQNKESGQNPANYTTLDTVIHHHQF
jgi:hypothetical protein